MVWCGGRVGGGEGGVRSIVRGGAGLGQNHKTELLGLGFGSDAGYRRGGGIHWAHWAPYRGNLRGGELGVSCYGGKGWCCSPWDLHSLPLHLFHSLPSTSAPMLLLGTHKWAGYSPMGLAFDADQV